VLESLRQYQQLLEKRFMSKRNPIVRHIGLVNIITDWSIFCVVAAQPVLLLLRTQAIYWI